SAKYDAEGTGGIINIITKKKNIEGISGAVNAGAGTRSSNLFSNLNYRQGRWGTGLNLGGFGYRGVGETNNLRITQTSTVENYLLQTGDNIAYGFGPFAQLTADVDLTSKSSLSGSLRLNNFNNGSKGDTKNDFSIDGTNYQTAFTNQFKTLTNGLSYDANVDYKKTFKKKEQELTFSGQLSRNNRTTDYEVDRIGLADTAYYKESSLNKNLNIEKTLQADYVHPVNKKLTLETGAKAILRDVISDYSYDNFDFSSNDFVEDPTRGNKFDYRQDVFAGYGQGTYQLGKVGIKAGLRYEHTEVNGSLQEGDTTFTNDYGNWIPTATVSYAKSGKYTAKISYTRRIQRPWMTYL
ncbi:MAG: outer membrane beta-barrel protein, partial [Flavobacteriales bacterium]